MNDWNWNALDMMMGQANFLDWFADPDQFDAENTEEAHASGEEADDPD